MVLENCTQKLHTHTFHMPCDFLRLSGAVFIYDTNKYTVITEAYAVAPQICHSALNIIVFFCFPLNPRQTHPHMQTHFTGKLHIYNSSVNPYQVPTF